jgi:hypothetical protein
MLRQNNSAVNFQYQNKKKKKRISVYLRKHLAFEVAHDSLLTSVLYIFICGET